MRVNQERDRCGISKTGTRHRGELQAWRDGPKSVEKRAEGSPLCSTGTRHSTGTEFGRQVIPWYRENKLWWRQNRRWNSVSSMARLISKIKKLKTTKYVIYRGDFKEKHRGVVTSGNGTVSEKEWGRDCYFSFNVTFKLTCNLLFR